MVIMEEKITAWAARDKDGTVCLYERKPEKGFYQWFSRECGQFAEIHDCIFSNVKWEDDEPKEFELTIKFK
jgi:hypothetical protein